MPTKPIITVVGATGAQGGSLVRSLLADPSGRFAVRAITRDRSSEAAQQLAKLGAEVVTADIGDQESLEQAFSGAHGAYCVTFFWSHFSPEKETEQAGNMARAAKATGVKHVIWSTLEDTRLHIPLTDDRMPTLMGNYKVPHFDAKGEADASFTKFGVPTTFMLTSFYWDNFLNIMAPQRGPDGTLGITFPMGDKKLPGIATEDIGRCAHGIFARGDELIGKRVGVAGEHLTGAQMAAALGKSIGQPVRYNDVPPDVYRSFGFPGAEDLGNMFQFKRDFEEVFCGARDLELARAINPALLTFEAWLAANGAKIPVA
jgi:uncharacterized protein YbjT (DUF2867 family)